MDISEAMKARHSVRSYSDRPIPEDIVRILKQEAENCNLKSGLRIQVITDEASAFEGFMAHYGNFRGVKNYIALVGKKSEEEKAGYFGEHLVLKAQALGLNTCWVAMTFKKSACKRNCRIEKGEKLLCVLALGYGGGRNCARAFVRARLVSERDGGGSARAYRPQFAEVSLGNRREQGTSKRLGTLCKDKSRNRKISL